MFVLREPGLWEWLAVTAAGVPVGLAFEWQGIGPWWYGFGLAAALWFIVAPYFHKQTAHPVAIVLILYPIVATVALGLLQPRGGYVFDHYILAADFSFGFRPGNDMMWTLLALGPVFNVARTAYLALPVAVAALFHTTVGRPLTLACLTIALAGFAAYSVFPAIGSMAAFPGGAPALRDVSAAFGNTMFADGSEYRNFMPSLHTAWGLVLLASAWRLDWRWKAAAVAYLVPMLSYTLVNGHYLCDMIAGAALASAAWSLAHRRWTNSAVATGLMAAWMVLIRFGLPVLYLSPLVPWLLTLGTVALVVKFYTSTLPREKPEATTAE